MLRRECKEWLGKKLLWMLFGLLLLCIIFFHITGKKGKLKEAEPVICAGVADLDGSMYSDLLVQSFLKNEAYKSYIRIEKAGKEEIERKFRQGYYDCYFIIPKGFVEKMIYMENEPVVVRINGENTLLSVLIQNVLSAYEKYIKAVEVNVTVLYNQMKNFGFSEPVLLKTNERASYDLVMTAFSRDQLFKYQEIEDERSIPVLAAVFTGLIVVLLSYLAFLTGIRLLKEKEAGILFRICLTGRSLFSYLFIKAFVFTVILTFVFALFYGTAVLAGEAGFSVLAVLEAFFFLFLLNSLFCLLAGVLSNRKNYILYGNFLVFFLLLSGGGIIPAAYLPDMLLWIGKVTPVYWFLERIILYYQGKDAYMGIVCFLCLFLSILFLFAAGKLLWREDCFEE